MNQEEAQESVDVLVDDLKFIMGVRPHTEWPAMAEAALEHHDPLIEDRLLTWQSRRLQRAAHLSLRGLVNGDAEQIRAGFLDIRTIESLSDAPPPSAPTPPAAPAGGSSDETPASKPLPIPRPVGEPGKVTEPISVSDSMLFTEPTVFGDPTPLG